MGAAFANPYVLPAIISGGSGLVAGMMGGGSGQQRASFEHTAIDPTAYGTDAKASISNALAAAVAHANEPIDLSSATPMSPGAFKASYPPRSVGGFPAGNAAPQRVAFNGLNIGPTGTGAGNFGSSGPARRRNPDAMMPEALQTVDRAAIPDKQIGDRFVPSTDTDPDARDAAGAVSMDPVAQGSARLLLHSIFSQPQKTAAVGA